MVFAPLLGELAFDGGLEDGGLVALDVGLGALEAGHGLVQAGELRLYFGNNFALAPCGAQYRDLSVLPFL